MSFVAVAVQAGLKAVISRCRDTEPDALRSFRGDIPSSACLRSLQASIDIASVGENGGYRSEHIPSGFWRSESNIIV